MTKGKPLLPDFLRVTGVVGAAGVFGVSSLREQTEFLPGFHNALHRYGQGSKAMRNLLLFRSSRYRNKSLFHGSQEAVDDFTSRPEKALQSLNPLKI